MLGAHCMCRLCTRISRVLVPLIGESMESVWSSGSRPGCRDVDLEEVSRLLRSGRLLTFDRCGWDPQPTRVGARCRPTCGTRLPARGLVRPFLSGKRRCLSTPTLLGRDKHERTLSRLRGRCRVRLRWIPVSRLGYRAARSPGPRSTQLGCSARDRRRGPPNQCPTSGQAEQLR